MDNLEKIKLKIEEIENYKKILFNYKGRWYDSGNRHLESLENELKELNSLVA